MYKPNNPQAYNRLRASNQMAPCPDPSTRLRAEPSKENQAHNANLDRYSDQNPYICL